MIDHGGAGWQGVGMKSRIYGTKRDINESILDCT